MSEPPFRMELLARQSRETFSCGNPILDTYFRSIVSQDVRRMMCACFVLTEISTDRIAGFYTLSSAEIVLSALPDAWQRKLPRYPSVPCVRIGRLALDVAFHGRGLGGVLIADAATRVLRSGIGAFALCVEAKDDHAATFYRRHGFQAYSEDGRRLAAPLAAWKVS